MLKKFTIRLPEDENIFYKTFRYPAGEVQIRLTQLGVKRMQAAEYTELILHAVPDVMRLAQLADAMSAVKVVKQRSLFLQYMPFARADRRFTEGDGFGLDIFLRHLALMDFTEIWTFDIHNESVTNVLAQKYGLKIANLKPTVGAGIDQILPCLRRMRETSGIKISEMALVSPDMGARMRYDLDQYKLPVILSGKKRDPESGALRGFEIADGISNPDIKAALIVDDICDGGGTFIGLADEIKKTNPSLKLGLYVSHGIFSKGLAPLKAKFDWVFTSDYSFRKPGQEVELRTGLEGMMGVCIR